MKKLEIVEVKIDKLVHGGQGIGVLPDGRKIFVWNALPGERAMVKLTKSKRDFAEGIATEILQKSIERIDPKESIYLATSPWQIMTLAAENKYKAEILMEAYKREGIEIANIEMNSDGRDFGYRNKIEFSFYGDTDGIHYAFYNRGTHQKQIVISSALALDSINTAAADLLAEINKLEIRAGDLKSVILRTTQSGKVVAALFVKVEEFNQMILPKSLSGLKVYHSNPKSPASAATRLIYETGDTKLSDKLLGTELIYDVIGFFQVNLPVFESGLRKIETAVSGSSNIIDMYSGVGSIGIPIKGTSVLVELDPANAKMAELNSKNSNIKVVNVSSESALDNITQDCVLIVDPPRSGLHKALVHKINQVLPHKVIYLSCNPSTQARDIAMLESYDIKSLEGYNFFPRTPHIESLAILDRK